MRNTEICSKTVRWIYFLAIALEKKFLLHFIAELNKLILVFVVIS